MEKLTAKRVPKCLYVDEERQRCLSSEKILEFLGSARSKRFPAAIGNHERNLVISLGPEKKQQSLELRHGGKRPPSPKKLPVQYSAGKVLAHLGDQDGIFFID